MCMYIIVTIINVFETIVWYLLEFSRLYSLHPWYWNSLSYGLISSVENLAHFLQLMPFTIFQIFVPSGTHHCWVDRGGMVWEVFAQHLYTWINNWHPWYWNSLIQSHLGRIQHLCTFAADLAIRYNLVFSFHHVPITAGCTEVASFKRQLRLAQH